MTPSVAALLNTANDEWEFFGFSTRSLNNKWRVGGEEHNSPYRERVQKYWKSVGKPTWDGKTKQPWSGAFISWCFKEAGVGKKEFVGSAKHSVYIDHIRRHQTATSKLQLKDPETVPLEAGDLVWNSRRDENTSNVPKSYQEAIARLKAGDFFISHVDIVVEVRSGQCDTIGGNVSNRDPGGSVTKSTWLLNSKMQIADARKSWIGVVKNGL